VESYSDAPERSDQRRLEKQIYAATHNPIIDGVMCMAGGLIAVLNQQQQILAVNNRLLEMLGATNPNEVVGLRPGEALGCVHADETASGCGTSPYCMTCGAAIAIVATSQRQDQADKTCAITIEKEGRRVDLFFRVHTAAIKVDNQRFVLVFLHDITLRQQQAALERAFFHDIKNTISGLLNASELLSSAPADQSGDLTQYIISLSKRLSREVELQRHLSQNGRADIKTRREPHAVEMILQDLKLAAEHYPSRGTARLEIINHAPGMVMTTDGSLLTRVLSNMLVNAFEAGATDQLVRLKVDIADNEIVFSVWNSAVMPQSVARRIFQRNFSTKDDIGRGLGTFSMKLIGEKLLGGHVDFESTPKAGTRFFISLPLEVKASNGVI
jgi:signal transduction histidine kinase